MSSPPPLPPSLPIPAPPPLDAAALAELAQARQWLENPGWAARAANVMGMPVEALIGQYLPQRLTRGLDAITRRALGIALKSAMRSLRGPATPARPRLHRLAVSVTGAGGGFFGVPGLAMELPLTTTLMLRSIADIARANGEDLADPATALACLEVLAHGGQSASDDGSESGYFAVRAAMAQQVNAAARHLAQHGLAHQGAPVLVQLLARVAAKFSVSVSEKLAAQAVPVAGAIGGAALNNVFIGHFQQMARGHFTVRRLERRHGEVAVREAYRALSDPT
ncbi:MAG TPA: EcsC family protein [Stenotrophomonas sp.]|jgi:hypothetical protein